MYSSSLAFYYILVFVCPLQKFSTSVLNILSHLHAVIPIRLLWSFSLFLYQVCMFEPWPHCQLFPVLFCQSIITLTLYFVLLPLSHLLGLVSAALPPVSSRLRLHWSGVMSSLIIVCFWFPLEISADCQVFCTFSFTLLNDQH